MSEELKILLAKEAIRDQLYTYTRALDRIDKDLGYTVFAEDSTVNYGGFFPKGTGREFVDKCCNDHTHMISTFHQMTNVLIKIDGDKAASETYMLAACKYPKKDGSGAHTVVARCRDIDRWECRDGKWLIVDRVVAGDNTMFIDPEMDLPNYNMARDKTDHSYTVFNEIK
ncbi:MAG: nuclear transport factor 2 family protein [Oscillospiraceae bacterium]